jgi:YHS domain-containing protein
MTEFVMEQLFFFIIWAGVIFLMMRLGCGAHIMGRRHGPGNAPNQKGEAGDTAVRWVPPKKDTDPVCGKTVMTDKAKPSVHDGNVYYFCSRECREVFEAAPDLYASSGDPDHPELEHSHA